MISKRSLLRTYYNAFYFLNKSKVEFLLSVRCKMFVHCHGIMQFPLCVYWPFVSVHTEGERCVAGGHPRKPHFPFKVLRFKFKKNGTKVASHFIFINMLRVVHAFLVNLSFRVHNWSLYSKRYNRGIRCHKVTFPQM